MHMRASYSRTQWREDFVVEYYGEGGANGCMGQPGGPHAQTFLHGIFCMYLYIVVGMQSACTCVCTTHVRISTYLYLLVCLFICLPQTVTTTHSLH